MKPLLIVLGIAGLLLGLVSGTEAQQSERVYPFFELTDEDVAMIDIHDGSIDDWLDVLGEPTLTALDFWADPRFEPYHPVDLDFRIWLAWHRSTNHIYVAMERSDDIYVNEYQHLDLYNVPSTSIMMRHDSSMKFSIDGDHSGGQYRFSGGILKLLQLSNQHAQAYNALGDILDDGDGPHVFLHPQGRYSDWFLYPPYTDGGGRSFGENPTISVTEFYVTPFDRLVYNSPEENMVSELFPGKIIGFVIGIPDHDSGVGEFESYHYVAHEDYILRPYGIDDADTFALGVLLGPGGKMPEEGVSAVESITWGRIKETFGK